MRERNNVVAMYEEVTPKQESWLKSILQAAYESKDPYRIKWVEGFYRSCHQPGIPYKEGEFEKEFKEFLK